MGLLCAINIALRWSAVCGPTVRINIALLWSAVCGPTVRYRHCAPLERQNRISDGKTIRLWLIWYYMYVYGSIIPSTSRSTSTQFSTPVTINIPFVTRHVPLGYFAMSIPRRTRLITMSSFDIIISFQTVIILHHFTIAERPISGAYRLVIYEKPSFADPTGGKMT